MSAGVNWKLQGRDECRGELETHRRDHVKVVINSPTPLRLQRKSSLGCNLQKRDKNNYTVTMQILYNLYTGVDEIAGQG